MLNLGCLIVQNAWTSCLFAAYLRFCSRRCRAKHRQKWIKHLMFFGLGKRLKVLENPWIKMLNNSGASPWGATVAAHRIFFYLFSPFIKSPCFSMWLYAAVRHNITSRFGSQKTEVRGAIAHCSTKVQTTNAQRTRAHKYKQVPKDVHVTAPQHCINIEVKVTVLVTMEEKKQESFTSTWACVSSSSSSIRPSLRCSAKQQEQW